MHTPVARRLIGFTALGLAACGAMGGPSTVASSSVPAPTATKMPAAHVAARPSAAVVIGERGTALGTVLTNAKGLTLYTFVQDKDGRSHCSGACATQWPPLMVGARAALKSSVQLPHALGTIARSGGMQVTYNGRPLYLFEGDKAPGQTNGEGVKHLWYVAIPSSSSNMAMAAPQPGPAMSPAPARVHVTAPPTARPIPAPVPPRTNPPRMTPPPNPIRQGGGGDHDSDNFGGPNDGDGNV